MYKHCNLMFMICESPLHAGSGSDLDFIDNPIQRERHTGFPKIESSSLKGALRERFTEFFKDNNGKIDPSISVAFGPWDPSDNDARQGSLGFSDAKLLLFPVKSMKGVFAWVTCPLALERFVQDMQRVDGQSDFNIKPLLQLKEGEAVVFSNELTVNNRIILEDFDFEANLNETLTVGEQSLQKWLASQLYPATDKCYEYWHGELTDKLVIISNDDFTDFVELTTEVITRNKINPETGTVAKGHLFTEEYLPADSVLYSLVMSHAEFSKNGNGQSAANVMKFFIGGMSSQLKNSFQAGGNATIGKGLIRTILINQTAPTETAPVMAEAEAV